MSPAKRRGCVVCAWYAVSRFCTAHASDQRTSDRQTDRQTTLRATSMHCVHALRPINALKRLMAGRPWTIWEISHWISPMLLMRWPYWLVITNCGSAGSSVDCRCAVLSTLHQLGEGTCYLHVQVTGKCLKELNASGRKWHGRVWTMRNWDRGTTQLTTVGTRPTCGYLLPLGRRAAQFLAVTCGTGRRRRSSDSGSRRFDVRQLPATSRLFTVSIIQWRSSCSSRRQRAIADTARYFRMERAGDADTALNNARACHTKPFVGENHRHLPFVYCTLPAIVYIRLPSSRAAALAFVSWHGRQLRRTPCIYCMYELYSFALEPVLYEWTDQLCDK